MTAALESSTRIRSDPASVCAATVARPGPISAASTPNSATTAFRLFDTRRDSGWKPSCMAHPPANSRRGRPAANDREYPCAPRHSGNEDAMPSSRLRVGMSRACVAAVTAARFAGRSDRLRAARCDDPALERAGRAAGGAVGGRIELDPVRRRDLRAVQIVDAWRVDLAAQQAFHHAPLLAALALVEGRRPVRSLVRHPREPPFDGEIHALPHEV